MAFDIPTVEPQEIICGDRIQWTKTLGDFPADEWTLTYYFRGNLAGAQIDVTATADDRDFAVDIPTTDSATYVPGTYYWQAFVSKSGDRKLVAEGRLVVKANPTDITEPVDNRSHARKVLSALDALIERNALTGIQRYTLQAVGRNVDRWPVDDLLKLREYYASLVRAEEMEEAIARGEAAGDQVLVRFRTER